MWLTYWLIVPFSTSFSTLSFFLACGCQIEASFFDTTSTKMIVFDILHTEAVLLYSLFFICAFENQRWFRSANYSSGFEREFAENTGLVAMVCQYLFCIAYAWDEGLAAGALLFVNGLILTMINKLPIVGDIQQDRKIVWVLCSVAIYPVIYLFSIKLSWFGFFPSNGFSLY